ncbi:MAG: molybdenum cofactor synthesis domain-containing protein, partial [Gemmatimonadota bacterium]
MIEVREADRILESCTRRLPVVDGPLEGAEGRVLREDIRADRDQPPYHRVAMDGIAVSTASVGAGVDGFAVQGVQAAGDPPMELAGVGSCIEVMTGAVLPGGCDTVVRIEDVEHDQVRGVLRVGAGLAAMKDVHRKGSDCAAGDVVVSAGSRLTPSHIAIAAAVGCTTLRLAATPRVAVVSTGNELVELAAEPEAHQVRRSNGYGIAAALSADRLGDVTQLHLPDDRERLERELARVLDAFDVLVVSGGVSMGRFDLVPAALQALGVETHFHKVSQRPGKPLWFGTRGETPVFGLPGNPVSTLVCLYRYVIPFLRRAAGEPDRALQVLDNYLLRRPDHEAVRMARVRLLLSRNDYDAAVIDLSRLRKQRPMDTQVNRLLVDTYLARHDLSSAAAVLREMAKAYPGDRRRQLQLASVMLRRQEYDEARRLYEDMFDPDDPRSVVALDGLAVTYNETGQPTDLPDRLDAFHKRHGGAEVLLLKARLLE